MKTRTPIALLRRQSLMPVEAIQSKRPQPKAAARPSTNPDGTPKFWFREDHCFYRDGKRHSKEGVQALLKKTRGDKFANYEGALEKRARPSRTSTETRPLVDRAAHFTPVSDQGRTVDNQCDRC